MEIGTKSARNRYEISPTPARNQLEFGEIASKWHNLPKNVSKLSRIYIETTKIEKDADISVTRPKYKKCSYNLGYRAVFNRVIILYIAHMSFPYLPIFPLHDFSRIDSEISILS